MSSAVTFRSRGVVIVNLLTAAVLAVACTNNGDDNSRSPSALGPSGPPEVSATRTAVSVDGMALPIQAYLASPAAQLVLGNASIRVQTDCMRRFGFTSYSVPARTPDSIPPNDQLYRRYGVTEDQDATRYGYHPVPGAAVDTAKKPAGTRLSPAESMVLTGNASGTADGSSKPASNYNGQQIPEGGCAGEARRKVEVAGAVDAGIVDSINYGMYDRSKQDSRVVAVTQRWSACMKEAGYDYPNPLAAMGSFPTTGTPSQAEIQAARADLACKKSTNLVGEWFSVESAYEGAAIQQNIQQLGEVTQRQHAAVVAAAGILGVPVPQ
jgi:hypothetical protein